IFGFMKIIFITYFRRLKAYRYSAAIYYAGVGVECLLRAYITRENPKFDERHDLRDLYQQSRLRAYIGSKHIAAVNAWLGDVWTRWRNNYRFVSDRRLRSEFQRLGYGRGIKGDFMKENARIAVDAALEFQTIGERRWTSSKNS
ncbi:MAG: hypothetical protein NTX50_10290, partial [Candidatus Sumerlaeota bacterium]|nr:hypothetical protein [Candidatus Sumerlaeota bacterium]